MNLVAKSRITMSAWILASLFCVRVTAFADEANTEIGLSVSEPVELDLAFSRRYTICHRPRSRNPRTLTISHRALRAHLRHGDKLGRCRPPRRYKVCHIPRNNPQNQRTLIVNERQLRAHLRHGDRRGRCRDNPPHSP